jgi:hypothetical protein
MAQGSFFDIMRQYFITRATMSGYEVVDMQSWFLTHYKIYRKRFEFATDAHWNSLGHKVVFEAVCQSKFISKFKK